MKRVYSAKEIALYVYCPKSWQINLTMAKESDDKKISKKTSDSEDKLKWLTDFDAARRLTWAANLIIFLIFFLVVFFILTRFR